MHIGRNEKMEKKFNIEKFLEKFKKEYNFLYEHDNVAGYDEAVNAFDDTMKNNESFSRFVGDFVKYRGDFISSDREAAAFMFTLESMEMEEAEIQGNGSRAF